MISLPVEFREEFPDSTSETVDREAIFNWLWQRFGEAGLVGIHEGTLLCDEAAEQGLETDSWLLDSAQAPPSRDWVGQQSEVEAQLYFSGLAEAQEVFAVLKFFKEIRVGEISELPNEDWNAQWKASFLNAGEGYEVPPFWRVMPPWGERKTQNPSGNTDIAAEKILRINPGAGFGTGTHETTQLCLEAIGRYSLSSSFNVRALDFGSGSGILAIAMAMLGASVDAVEVDPLALDNAQENSKLNSVEDQIRFSLSLEDESVRYQVVVANILKPILIEYSELLNKVLVPEGTLILSGLIQSDVAAVKECYQRLRPSSQIKELQRGEWFALVISPFVSPRP